MKKNIFIPVVGQFTNVGDAMHRRELLSWLKNAGTLHVFVGNAPKHFIDALDLPHDAKVYTNILGWIWNLTLSPFKKTHFVFNPGEITVGAKRLMFEVLLLPFEWLVKAKKGQILRVGIAAVSNAVIKRKMLWKYVLNQSNKIYWRTIDSKETFGLGVVIPDLAFLSPKLVVTSENRDLLVVSMRGDRPIASDGWFKAIKSFANQRQLKIIVVSQVRMDNERGKLIARELGAETCLWDDKLGHIEQEEKVRHIYTKTRLVVSDRLHVLIAALTNGALPSVVLTHQSDKIKDHFDAIGVENISCMFSTEEQMILFLIEQSRRTDEVYEAVYRAQRRLGEVREEILSLLS